MPPVDECPWCPARLGAPGDFDEVWVYTNSAIQDLENLAITVQYAGGSGAPMTYQLPQMTGHENVVYLPADAFDDNASGEPVTGVTFDYTRVGEPFSYSEPLYLEF